MQDVNAEQADVAKPELTKPEPQLPKTPKKFIPEFYGDSNAFSIQLFCIDEKYEMR